MSDTTFTFTSPDKVEIFVRKWASLGGMPKGAVQIAHGAAEHSQRYERLAQFLNAGGYVVYANDHRGHGRTALRSGKLGVAGADAWNGFVKDAGQLTDIVRRDYPISPIFFFGHSMGSLIAQDCMARWGAEFTGVILCGTTGFLPGLDALVSHMGQAAQTAADEPSTVFGQIFASFNAPFAPGKTAFEWLSRDESEVQKYVTDPLCGFLFSNGLAYEFLKGLRELWKPEKEARIPKSLPILVISGDKDPVGGNTLGITPLLERYKSMGMQNLTRKFYPDARHEILNETNRDEVQRDILSWLNKWC
jgi:alpha-beta hydrolase superfamily lysophospholipase